MGWSREVSIVRIEWSRPSTFICIQIRSFEKSNPGRHDWTPKTIPKNTKPQEVFGRLGQVTWVGLSFQKKTFLSPLKQKTTTHVYPFLSFLDHQFPKASNSTFFDKAKEHCLPRKPVSGKVPFPKPTSGFGCETLQYPTWSRKKNPWKSSTILKMVAPFGRW